MLVETEPHNETYQQYCWKTKLHSGNASRKLEMTCGGSDCPCIRTWWYLVINDITILCWSTSSKPPKNSHHGKITEVIYNDPQHAFKPLKCNFQISNSTSTSNMLTQKAARKSFGEDFGRQIFCYLRINFNFLNRRVKIWIPFYPSIDMLDFHGKSINWLTQFKLLLLIFHIPFFHDGTVFQGNSCFGIPIEEFFFSFFAFFIIWVLRPRKKKGTCHKSIDASRL